MAGVLLNFNFLEQIISYGIIYFICPLACSCSASFPKFFSSNAPPDNKPITYCGIDLYPQIFALKCEGALQARQRKDMMLRCGPCEDMRVERHKELLQMPKRKYESTLQVESILMKPFVSLFDKTRLVAFLKHLPQPSAKMDLRLKGKQTPCFAMTRL